MTMKLFNKHYVSMGIIPIVVAASLWAFGYFLRKGIFDSVSPILVNFFTCWVVSAIIFIVYRINYRSIIEVFWRYPFRYLGLSLTGVALGTTFMFLAIDNLDLGIATLLEKLQPIFILLLSTWLIKEAFPIRKLPFVLLAIISTYFVSTKFPFDLTFSSKEITGIIYVILAGLSWALASIIGKTIVDKKAKAEEITFLRFGLGGIFLFPFFLFNKQLNLSMYLNLDVISIIVIAAVISTTLGYVLYYRGLRFVAVSTAGFLELFTPIVGLLLGITFLNESLVITQWFAIPILLFSIFRILRR